MVENVVGNGIKLRLNRRVKLVWLHGRGSVYGLNTRRMLGGGLWSVKSRAAAASAPRRKCWLERGNVLA
ncbi:hypothetical protein GCM10009104_29620 [Marinobacterium maritimum]|uniref:Uncharacterized protein n=1 Tax=Marinobacterium maritimum TaxID=500162 RepID=A0ABN1I9C2_9GAMM